MPGGNKNIKGSDGNTFSADNQPANRGRKKKLFTQFVEEQKAKGIEPASRETVSDVIRTMLAMQMTELIEIRGSVNAENGYPFLLRLIAKELTGKNGLVALKEFLDRANGRAVQAVAVEANQNIRHSPPDFSKLSQEEKLALLALLEKVEINTDDAQ